MRIIIDGRQLPGSVRTNRDLLITLRNIAKTLNWGIRYDSGREIVLINSKDSSLPPKYAERLIAETPIEESPRLEGKVICLDPGHGGGDCGSTGPAGTLEKDNTLAIAILLKDMLEKNGAAAILTRQTDTEVAAPDGTPTAQSEARVAIANEMQADIFVSIHNDYFTNRAKCGVSVFHYGDQESERLAKCVQNSLISKLGSKNRGCRFASLYILRYTKMPAIIVQTGFISNPEEEMLLSSADGREKMAESIFEGIAKFYKV